MRSIKFRCWDTKYKKWVKPPVSLVPHQSSDNYKSMYLEAWDIISDEGPNIDIVFLQYTGLKDKNGKEIYEGDVVAFTDEKLANRIPPKKNRVIKWTKNGFNIKHKYISKDGIAHGVEVIGNIYENPDLLKDTNPDLKQT